MVTYISVFKVLAACLITNSHYSRIYPLSFIANGGLIGDVLFFAISGYCLYNIKGTFLEWYSKRLVRCYVPVIVITFAYMLLGYYDVNVSDAFWWYVYPTYYHFVASIVVLYIPYYIVIKKCFLRSNLLRIMLAVFMFYMVTYIFAYDKTYYHIDNVRQPFIRFLFFESMLLGAWFRQNDRYFRNRQCKKTDTLFVIATFIAYFVSKILFSRNIIWGEFQFINQLLIFLLLYCMLRLGSSRDSYLSTHVKGKLYAIVTYIASITLEIYVVQYVIIEAISDCFIFPANWLVVTCAILLSAVVLHYVCGFILWLGHRIRRCV